MISALKNVDDLVLFGHVVEHRGFAAAARALGIPKSRLSRRIAQLEEQLGIRLLQRSSRHFSVTEIGERYYQHCRAIMVEAQAAQEVIDHASAAPQGIVRISCPVALLHAQVASMLIEFMQRHPRITTQLTATNRRVDVVAEGFDLAIRARTPPLEDSSLVMRELAQHNLYLVASPLLCERYPAPQNPADLETLPSIGDGPVDQAAPLWQLVGPNGATASVPHRPRLVTDDLSTRLDAAVAGLGVTQLPAMMMEDELRSGRLVQLLPGWCSHGAVVHAVFPSRRGLLPSVRALLDFLAEKFAALPAD
ncbi:MAG: LysR substrate-binding domain-containing protein [Steroidobacteraceae bacterium]